MLGKSFVAEGGYVGLICKSRLTCVEFGNSSGSDITHRLSVIFIISSYVGVGQIGVIHTPYINFDYFFAANE